MLTLLKDVEVYAPEYLGRKDVLLSGGKIHKIADKIAAAKGCDMEVVKGNGKLLFPGFIDSHVHILGGGGEGGYKTRTPEICLTDITMGGVTTVLGLLGTDGTTRTMSNLIAKANGLEEEGVSTYIYTGSYQVPVRTVTGSILDDIVLLEKVIGCGEIAVSDHRSSQPTLKEFMKIVAETRVGGILSGKAGVVNIHLGDGERGLKFLKKTVEKTEIPASQMMPTHINRNKKLFKEGVKYAKEMGGLLDFTTSFDKEHLLPEELAASEALKLALEAGVPKTAMTFSSDGQGSLPVFDEKGEFAGLGVGKVTSLYEEVKDAIGKGVSIPDALAVITENPARIYKLKGKGRIASEMDADLVLVHPETLAIDMVFAKGVCMVKKGKPEKKGTFEK